jgi:hypothetical protein
MEWQPIETAPKDGTWILVTGGDIGYNWDGDTIPAVTTAQWHYKSWQMAWFDSGCLGEYDNPTHWMPLPQPPKDNQ